jgi:hypothetical protein
MLQESSKRAAPTSPPDPDHDAKRLRLGTDLWSEDEHRQQDERIKQLFEDKDWKVNDPVHMIHILNAVSSVALEGPHSHMVSTSFELNIQAFDSFGHFDPKLMKLVGDCYKKGSYKDVRCLGASFLPPAAIKLSMMYYLLFQKCSARSLPRS